jgi:hypothetical protein
MYYIVQENVFREFNYDNLIKGLKKMGYPYEIVQVIPFVENIKFKTKRKDVFPFGSLKIARISNQYNWYPGSQMNENHDFMVYKKFYKENLLNYDSKIIKFGDKDFFSKKRFFARPTKDTKVFTGSEFDMQEWRDARDSALTSGHTTVLDKETEIQISTIKKIQQEIRFWIVKGKIITASQYLWGSFVNYDDNVDPAAYDYCREMIKLFELNEAFVMDICLTEGNYKIVECGCINCAGFYKADMQKLLYSLEEAF